MRRALDLSSETDPARGPLLLKLGRSLFRSEGGGEAELLSSLAALRATGDVEGMTEAELFLADLYHTAGKPELYHRHLASATSLASELGATSTKADALVAISADANRSGDYQQSLAVGREALALIEDLGLDELRVRALNVIGWARLETDDEGGFADLERSIEIASAAGSPMATRGHANIAHHLRHRGHFKRSLEHLEEAMRLADRFGDVPMGRFLRGILAHNRYRQGPWDDALEAAGSYLEEVGESHHTVWHALGTRGLIRLSRGDDGGIEDSDGSIEAARRSVDPTTLPATLEVRARSLLLAGRHDEAAQAMEEALAILETGIVRPGFDLAHLVVMTVELGGDIQRGWRWPDRADGRRPRTITSPATSVVPPNLRRDGLAYRRSRGAPQVRWRAARRRAAFGGRGGDGKSARVLQRGRSDVLRPAGRGAPRRGRVRDSRVEPARARSPRRAP